MFESIILSDVVLRSLRDGDTEELFALVDSNRDRLREWLPWLDRNTEVGATREFIRVALEQEAEGRGFTCAVVESGRIVGVAGFHPFERAVGSAEIGYWLAREAVGKGIMTRCCRVLVDHAFRNMDAVRVVIPAAVGNHRSRAVPERLGFRLEHVVPAAEWLYDRFVDHAVYVVSRGEWLDRSP